MNPLTFVQKLLLLFAAASGASAVVLGALGAHWLKDQLNYFDRLAFTTATQYQIYHTLAIVGVVLLMKYLPSKILKWSGFAFGLGIILFSGSIYILTLNGLLHMTSLIPLGPITPIGGLALILGWVLLGVAVIAVWKKGRIQDI